MKLLKLAILVAAIAGCNAAPHWDGKLTDKIPAPVRTALEQAQELELLSLEPKRPDPSFADDENRRSVLGKTRITNDATLSKILTALDAGARPDKLSPAFCFEPQHAIRIKHSGKTLYLVMCFECQQVKVFVDDEPEVKLNFLINSSPELVFDEVLKAAGIPLAEKRSHASRGRQKEREESTNSSATTVSPSPLRPARQ
jgi:hypothetical protein